MELIDHSLSPEHSFKHIRYETRPIKDRKGNAVEGLHQVWIWLDNEKQLNSYTTNALRELQLAARRASNDRRAVTVVLTGAGTKAFCTGGNTAEYATYYANRPLEYLQYMRLFNDAVTSLLLCDKPVIARVNGMRLAGGQELGMGCDFTVAGDHTSFGQAGPVHGSAPDGGATDMLDLYVGFAFAAESLVLCEPWSALKAYRYGLVNEVVPVHKDASGKLVANPLVVTDRERDEFGRPVLGEWKVGAEKDAGKKALESMTIDLTELDHAVDRLATKILNTFPDCTRKTLESLRKKKLQAWFANSETNRSWLSLNMNVEAAAGFPAFHFGERPEREINFALLRRRLAEGARFDEALIKEVLPELARNKREEYRRG